MLKCITPPTPRPLCLPSPSPTYVHTNSHVHSLIHAHICLHPCTHTYAHAHTHANAHANSHAHARSTLLVLVPSHTHTSLSHLEPTLPPLALLHHTLPHPHYSHLLNVHAHESQTLMPISHRLVSMLANESISVRLDDITVSTTVNDILTAFEQQLRKHDVHTRLQLGVRAATSSRSMRCILISAHRMRCILISVLGPISSVVSLAMVHDASRSTSLQSPSLRYPTFGKNL